MNLGFRGERQILWYDSGSGMEYPIHVSEMVYPIHVSEMIYPIHVPEMVYPIHVPEMVYPIHISGIIENIRESDNREREYVQYRILVLGKIRERKLPLESRSKVEISKRMDASIRG